MRLAHTVDARFVRHDALGGVGAQATLRRALPVDAFGGAAAIGVGIATGGGRAIRRVRSQRRVRRVRGDCIRTDGYVGSGGRIDPVCYVDDAWRGGNVRSVRGSVRSGDGAAVGPPRFDRRRRRVGALSAVGRCATGIACKAARGDALRDSARELANKIAGTSSAAIARVGGGDARTRAACIARRTVPRRAALPGDACAVRRGAAARAVEARPVRAARGVVARGLVNRAPTEEGGDADDRRAKQKSLHDSTAPFEPPSRRTPRRLPKP